jgi:hypothetical protein
MFLIGFPLLIIPFAIYNIVAFLMPGVSWSGALTHVPLVSGAMWTLSAGEILIAFAILLLFVEVLKSSRLARRTVVDHALSLLLFLGMTAEFLLVKEVAGGIFFLLLVISFVDVLSGLAVTLRSAAPEVSVESVGATETVETAAPAENVEGAGPVTS